MSEDVVATELVGAVWPATEPGEDPVLYGHVELEPKGALEARSLQTFRLIYTVGRYGIDDTGSIRIVFRFMGDWGDFQTYLTKGLGVTREEQDAIRANLLE